MNFNKKYIPNILSVVRLCMIPMFVYVFFTEKTPRVWAAIVFLAAGLTDIIDGYLARKFNWITESGKILDPMADKLMQASAMVSLAVATPKYFIWIAVVFFAKELTLVIGAFILAKRLKGMLPSCWYGKMATVVFAAITVVFIIYPDNGVINILLTVILACTLLFALLMYYLKVFRRFKKAGTRSK